MVAMTSRSETIFSFSPSTSMEYPAVVLNAHVTTERADSVLIFALLERGLVNLSNFLISPMLMAKLVANTPIAMIGTVLAIQ